MRELREGYRSASLEYDLGYDPDDEILVTAGASEGLDVAFRALVDPGDVALPQPSYISYVPGVIFAGGEPLAVPTREEDDFKLTYEVLERPVRPTPTCWCSATRTTQREPS